MIHYDEGNSFLKSCGLLEALLVFPRSLSSPYLCLSFQGEEPGAGLGTMGLGTQLLFPTPTCPSPSSRPLRPLCSPALPRAAPPGPPASFAHRGGCPAAHCQARRIKIPSGKTRGSKSNINLQDLAFQPQCPFPGYLATDKQLLMVSFLLDHHCDSRISTHTLPAGSTHLRTPRVRLLGNCSEGGVCVCVCVTLPPLSLGSSLKLFELPDQPSSQVKTAPLTLWGRSPAQRAWVPLVAHPSAAKSSSLQVQKE